MVKGDLDPKLDVIREDEHGHPEARHTTKMVACLKSWYPETPVFSGTFHRGK